MKKILLLTLAAFGLLFVTEAYAQQGIGTDMPEPSAALEIRSIKRGLLIPRFNIPDLQQANPVSTPANYLLVFNTGLTTPSEKGFYYWDTDHWVPVNQMPDAITVSGEGRINVDQNGNDFEVSITPGTLGQLLVTVDHGNGLEADWVDFDEIFKIDAKNGLTLNTTDPDETVVELGGPLTRNTDIDATGFDFSINGLDDISAGVQGGTIDLDDYQFLIMDSNGILHRINYQDILPDELVGEDLTLSGELEFVDANQGAGAVLKATEIRIKAGQEGEVLTTENGEAVWAAPAAPVGENLVLEGPLKFVSGFDGVGKLLEETQIEIEAGTVGQVLTTDANGDVVWEAPAALNAESGLHVEADANGVDAVHLGGPLLHASEITTDATNTLAIEGLQESNASNKIVVVDDSNEVLRTVRRALTHQMTASISVDGIANYNINAQEIYIYIDVTQLNSGDKNLTLPTGAPEGQIVYVRITDDTNAGEPDDYLNIIDGGNTLTYGSMPTQGWVLKSNGSKWSIIAKN